MFRTLIIIAAAGFVLSAACLGGALALGERDAAARGWSFPGFWSDFHSWHGNGRDWSGPRTTREIPWDAGHELTFAYSGEVHFHQGPEHKMVVTGPADAVNDLHMEDGRVRDSHDRYVNGLHLDLDVTAPDIDSFKIAGSPRVTIDGYAQDRLAIDIGGSGDVVARGAARTIDVAVHGSGDADLGDVASEEAEVESDGSGNATIAPTQRARIEIRGSGDVTLLTNPPQVVTNSHGSGTVRVRPRAPQSALPAKP